MKRLVIFSKESIFAGIIECGIAEMVDSLANSLGSNYDVNIICPDGNGVFARSTSGLREIEDCVRTCRFSNVNYYMIKQDMWPTKAVSIAEKLQPDILHNIAEPELLSMMSKKPEKTLLTFDNAEHVLGKESYLTDYDEVTTTSKSYAGGLMRARNTLSGTLCNISFHGVTNGILDTVFAPEKGILLHSKYTADNQAGKRLCKKHLLQTYGIYGNPYICLMMCRLIQEKGIEDVLKAVPHIKKTGGVLIVVGKGDEKYENQLREFRRSDGVIYVDRWASPVQAAPLTAGADFYIQPSVMESCGLMPLTASRYGAIPIITLNGGLADSFNDDNAIVVDDNGLEDAITRAAEIYADKDALKAKRKICMEQDFSWTTRKEDYIKLYEG